MNTPRRMIIVPSGFTRRPEVALKLPTAAARGTCRTAWIVSLLILVSGCADGVESGYGSRTPAQRRSVNGTAVLSDLFEEAGHQVSSWRWLSPRLDNEAEVIVWFPDDFDPPTVEVCDWLNTWLEAEYGRTLIYVARDYDAAPTYWENVRPGGSNELADEYARRLADARSAFRTSRQSQTGPTECDWFTIDPTLKPRRVETLSGDPAWTSGVDPAAVEIELNGRLIPPDGAEALLESDGDVLVSRQWVGRGQLIVVANGSFLLNVPLVNYENRKLAARLIEEIGPEPKHVVFLESGLGGPVILERDPDVAPPSGLEFYGVPPLDRIFFQLALLGLIFCFTRLPIFGIPQEDSSTFHSDFGQHVTAMGELLERTGDVAYANHQIEHHRSQTRSEGLYSGVRPRRSSKSGRR